MKLTVTLDYNETGIIHRHRDRWRFPAAFLRGARKTKRWPTLREAIQTSSRPAARQRHAVDRCHPRGAEVGAL